MSYFAVSHVDSTKDSHSLSIEIIQAETLKRAIELHSEIAAYLDEQLPEDMQDIQNFFYYEHSGTLVDAIEIPAEILAPEIL